MSETKYINSQEYIPKTSLKLLIVGAKEGQGNVHIDKFIPSLRKVGHKITFVGWDRNKKLPYRYKENGVQHQIIFRGWGYGMNSLMLGLPLWCIRLFCHLLFQKPDVIIAIDLDCAFSAALAKMFRDVPLVYVILDTYALRPTIPVPLRGAIQRVDNWLMKKSDSIIVPDETRILPEYKHKEKFNVMYNCCFDISDQVPAEQKDRSGKPFTVLSTGRLLKNRGAEVLLKAAEQLPDMHIIMAGDIREKDIQQRVDNNPNINFLGRVGIETAFRLAFDADAVFTYYEPSSEINRRAASNKWADAMMASRAILANYELVKADWIRKNDIGYLCPFYDVGALVKCLKHIQDNRDDAVRKGANGRKMFEEGYNWETMEQRLWNLLDHLATEQIRT